MDTPTEREHKAGKQRYLYLATARGRRLDYSLFLYAEHDEQARALADTWWQETCEIAPDLEEQYSRLTVEKQTTMRRAGHREYEPVITIE
jgi:hypothetical protein